MDLNSLNEKIESNAYYKLTLKHKKVLTIIEGIIIISLLISINIYVVKDHFIKKQISEKCGYIDSRYQCICERHYAENWKALKDGNYDELNFIVNKNDSVDK